MPSGQTTVIYGSDPDNLSGLMISRCNTKHVRSTPVYDDSGTDILYFKHEVRVEGYVHGNYDWLQLSKPDLRRMGSATYGVIGMRVQLPPRQAFRMRVGADASGVDGGYLHIYAEPYPSKDETKDGGITHLDVNNGPRCSEFIIKRIVADNVFQVEAEFVVCKVECSISDQKPSGIPRGDQVAGSVPNNTKGILSNRWTVTDTLDTNLRTIREYHGRLRVASNKLNPNQFRALVVPPLQAGMRRDSVQFSVSPDGLNLDYFIRDTEIVTAAPYPAKTWAVNHTEMMDQALITHAKCDITLTGDRDANTADLIVIGMNVLTAKLLNGNANATGMVILDSLSITDYIGDENRVLVSGSVRRLPKNVNKENPDPANPFEPWFFGNQIIGRPLKVTDVYKNAVANQDNDYDGNHSFGGLPDSAHVGGKPFYNGPISLISAILPYLQTPCNDTHEIVPSAYDMSDDNNTTPAYAPIRQVSAAVDNGWTDNDRDLYGTDAKANIYTHWTMESVFDEPEMKLVLPVANSGYSPDGQAIAVVTLSKPQCQRIVRVEAERVGAWPKLPSGSQLISLINPGSGAGSPSLTQTFIGKKRRFSTPFYTAGGQKAYRVAADYYYALNRRPNDSENLPVGRSIWTTDGDISTTTDVTGGWTS